MPRNYSLLTWLILLLSATGIKAQQDSIMFAHYINVGQAAAVLLEFPCGAILIDAGAQDQAHDKGLLDYLGRFFQRRKDLDSTLSLVMVTHPHIDHNFALKDVVRTFRVNKYIDDGLKLGSGQPNQVWMQDTVAAAGIAYRSYSFEEITKNGNREGMTDSIIDPVNCTNGDPQIIMYSGRFDQKPVGWTKADFSNYNNHSLVIKVLFGRASFLFTGDLETKGIKAIVDEYAGTHALDVDVLMVGHHGAANATTVDYLNEVTPSYAVISCGESDFGEGSSNPFTTFAYGHPRISTITMLQGFVTNKRPQSVHVKAASAAKKFQFIDIDQCIYATPWDNNVVIKATTDGKYEVSTSN